MRIRTEEGTREWRVRTSLRHWTFLLTGCQPRQYLNVVWYCEIGGEYKPRRAGACPALRLDARELQGSKKHKRARTEVGEGVLEFVDELDEVGVHGWEDGWRVVGVVKGVVDEEDVVESLQSSNIGLSELGAKNASPRRAPDAASDPWALPTLVPAFRPRRCCRHTLSLSAVLLPSPSDCSLATSLPTSHTGPCRPNTSLSARKLRTTTFMPNHPPA